MEIENNGTIMELYDERLTLFSTLTRVVSLCHRANNLRESSKSDSEVYLRRRISRDARIRIGFLWRKLKEKTFELSSPARFRTKRQYT